MNRFIFSLPSLYRLDRHRAARIRVHSQKISILRLLTLALSSNEEEREIELNFVRDRAHRPKVRDCPLVGSEDELSRAPLQLTCVVDDPRQTDHRSDPGRRHRRGRDHSRYFHHGRRPEFCLNSLRFGPITGHSPNVATNRRLFTGVVSGIAHYGNCIGIPTIGGEIYFDESFEGNPLVNVFCLGVLRHDQLARGAARGVGNPVFYVGAETGRDGLAGAAFASRELTEQSKEDRPAVQVGDPFKEKLLLEACLELLARDAVAGMQDMGAAGLTCSTCETASRGGSGIEIDLAKVPKREPGMTPYEILLSESQERMLIIAKRGKGNVVREIFDKWDVPWAEIGRVTGDGMMRVRNNGSIAAEIPAKPLAEEAPLYSRKAKPPSSVAAVYDRRVKDFPTIDNKETF